MRYRSGTRRAETTRASGRKVTTQVAEERLPLLRGHVTRVDTYQSPQGGGRPAAIEQFRQKTVGGWSSSPKDGDSQLLHETLRGHSGRRR